MKREFLLKHPLCCFCGGESAADTVDHVPSRQMFSLRRRPKGLEVPACKQCNNSTSQHEQVAAMLGRVYPDAGSDAENEETARIIHAVNNNFPNVLREMTPSRRQERQFESEKASLPEGAAGVLNVSGPHLNRSIQIFGAKMGFALFYQKVGKILPKAGGVAVRWYSNHDAIAGKIPEELLRILGPEETLQQGRWNVNDQFNYSFAMPSSRRAAAFFSTFRKSFAVLSWASVDVQSFSGTANLQVHRPGLWTTSASN